MSGSLSDAEVAAAREAFEALLNGDPEPWIALLAEDTRWDISAHPLPDVPDRGRGRAESAAVWRTYISGWNDYRAEVTEMATAGCDLVFEVRETVRVGETDVPLERDLAYVWTFRDGRVTLLRIFRTAADAKRAIGL